MTKRGFTLLEIMIVTLIAAVISTGLLTTILQISRLQETVNTITSVYGRAALLQNQLERDVMGAFIPSQVDMIQTTTVKQAQVKPLEKIFFSKNKGEQLDLLTFITSSPLQIYFGITNIKLKPRVARVVYRLIPDTRRKNSYVLTRQEGTKPLRFESYNKDAQGDLRSYPMIDGIYSLSIQYISIEQKTGDDEKKSVKRIYKKQKEWESQKKQDDKKKKAPLRLPNQIELHVELWDSTYTNHRPFMLTIPIIAMSGDVIQQREDLKKKDSVQIKKMPQAKKSTGK